MPRGEFVVSSKVGWVSNPEVGGPPLFDFSRDRVLSSLAESLERLRLDAIDMVFLHLLGDTPYHYQQALHEALPALAELRSQGVVRAIGVGTTIETWEMLAPFAQEGGSDCFLVASRYTLMDHSALEQFLPLAFPALEIVRVGGVEQHTAFERLIANLLPALARRSRGARCIPPEIAAHLDRGCELNCQR